MRAEQPRGVVTPLLDSHAPKADSLPAHVAIMEPSTLLLFAGLVVQIFLDFRGIAGGVELEAGRFYNSMILTAVLIAFLALPAIGIMLVHLRVMVRKFTASSIRIGSSLAGIASYFLFYQLLLMALGGFVHAQFSAIDYYCVRHPEGNESRCAHAMGKSDEFFSPRHRLIEPTPRWYSRLNQKTENADMTLFSQIGSDRSRK